MSTHRGDNHTWGNLRSAGGSETISSREMVRMVRCECGRGDTPSQHISLSASYLNPDPPARRLTPLPPSAPYYSRRGFIFTCGLPPCFHVAGKKANS